MYKSNLIKKHMLDSLSDYKEILNVVLVFEHDIIDSFEQIQQMTHINFPGEDKISIKRGTKFPFKITRECRICHGNLECSCLNYLWRKNVINISI